MKQKTVRTTPRSQPAKRVAILGLGLMGGSLGLALRRLRRPPAVAGYARRAETRRLALRMGAVDQVFDDPAEAVRNADWVVLCTPILSMPDLAGACAGACKNGAVMTDVGSTKAFLAKILANLPVPFIGSHPIAGSERMGIEAASPDLYRNAVVVLSPRARDSRAETRRLAALWRSVGARPLVISPTLHDRIIAQTSHLPHLVAATLVLHASRANPRLAARLCGNGFRDATRIAAGSPEMWHDIAVTNAPAISRELRSLSAALLATANDIEAKRFAAVRRRLARAREQRLLMGFGQT